MTEPDQSDDPFDLSRFLVGCLVAGLMGWACATVPQKLKPMSCLVTPPPVQTAFHPVSGGDEACPRRYLWCLDDESSMKLVKNMTAYREWAQDAWARCGRAAK